MSAVVHFPRIPTTIAERTGGEDTVVKAVKRMLILGLGTCVPFLLYGASGAGPTVSLIKVYRTAECLKPPSAVWSPAGVGTALKASDSLRTSNNSYADMQLDPPNRFRLKENSLLKIERLSSESKDPDGSLVKLTDLGLLKGDIIARLDKLPVGTRLNLRSPVAVAAVRGTAFSLGTEDVAGATCVAVSRGTVNVTAVGEPEKYVNVNPDCSTTVAPWATALLRAKGTGLPPKELLIKRLDDPKVPLKDAKELLERLKNPKPSLSNIVLGAEAKVVAPEGIGSDQESERWATAEARYLAQKQIIEKLETIRLSGDETVGDVMNKDPKICEELLGGTGAATVIKAEYDKKERCATLRLEYPLEKVRKIIDRDITLAWKNVTPISLTEYAGAFGAFIRAATERAATVDAYRRLAEKIYGTVVTSSTTLKNFAVKNDQVDVAVKGVVQGAEEVSKTYYSDGSIDVVLQISGAAVRGAVTPVTGDVLGKHYMSSPSAIGADEFIGLLALEGM